MSIVIAGTATDTTNVQIADTGAQATAQNAGDLAQGTASATVGEGAAATAEGSTPETKVVLTKAEKLAKEIETLIARITKDTESLAQKKALFENIDKLENLRAGGIINARVGRGETAREVLATVVGSTILESGDRRLKIAFGEGFDYSTEIIQDSQIISVVSTGAEE